MKRQGLIWFFILGIFIIILFAFNYQGGGKVISLSEIFPEEKIESKKAIEYEYVDAPIVKVPEKPVPAVPDTTEVPEAPVAYTPDFSAVAFTIQISSHKGKGAAEKAFKKANAKGYPAYLVEKDLGKRGLWYRVYVGTFETRSKAYEFLLRIKKDYTDSFVIVPK